MMKGVFGIVLGIFLISSLLIGQTIYKSEDIENIYEVTRKIETPDLTNCSIETGNFRVDRINKIKCSFIEFVIITGLETTKFGVEFGFENPQYDYNFYMKLVKLWIISLIIALLVPIMVPLIALIYLFYVGGKKLFDKLKRRNSK